MENFKFKNVRLIALMLALILAMTACSSKVRVHETVSEDGVTLSDDSSDFALLSEAVPDAILEIRYYSTYNFVGERIDGYEEPLALLTKEAAVALKEASDELLTMGFRLKIFDAYRPQMAVTHFMNWAMDPDDVRMKEYFYPELEKDVLFPQGYIAEHSGHSRGSTVDLTLFDMKTEREVDMGGTFDYFGELSHPDYTGITPEQYANRMILREVMLKHGFKPLAEEWWHFTLENEPYPDTYFTFPINSDSITSAYTPPQPSAATAVQQPLNSNGITSNADSENILEASTAEETAAEASALGAFWTEGSTTAQTLSAYVAAATDEDSETFIPEEDRIAVFDLDGTLMCETCPWCFEYMVFADYVLNGPGGDAEAQATAREILDSAWGEKPANMSTRQAAAGARAYAGITPEELTDYVKAFRSTAADGFSGMTRGEAWYQPMLEVVSFLQDNGFTIYIVTATERNIVRGIVDGVLQIPPSHVIGTEYGYTATGQDGTADSSYTFQKSDKVVFDGSYAGENAKMCKVDAIVREIGQQPVLAFGNSSGDLAMLQYVITGNQYPSASFIVLADDEVREYGEPASAAEKRVQYEAAGLTCISMRDDFAAIYGENVTKAPVQ